MLRFGGLFWLIALNPCAPPFGLSLSLFANLRAAKFSSEFITLVSAQPISTSTQLGTPQVIQANHLVIRTGLKPPLPSGFEAVGTVVATGPLCVHVKKGQHVAVLRIAGSGRSYLVRHWLL